MATYIPVTNIPTQFFDAAGDPLINGSLEFFLAGTTTATDLYSDDAGTSIGVSITLNSLGYPESGGNLITLFRDQSKALKIDCLDSVGATVWTMDDIPATAAFDVTSSAKLDLITVTAAIDLDTIAASTTGALPTTGGTMSGDLNMGSQNAIISSVSSGIIASVTHTQGEQELVSDVNYVETVANDNDVVSLPTAVAGLTITVFNTGANTLQIFPATDDSIDALAVDASTTLDAGKAQVFKAKTSVVWETLLDIVTPFVSGSSKYGSFFDEGNATAFVINATTDVHAYHTATLADGGSSGWTFDVGSAGVPVAIASIADGAASGVDIAVTTTGNHGLAEGDIISQTNLASSVYTGIFAVKAIISATIYEVAAVYTATDTGTVEAAATLTCDAGSDGNYILDWTASASAATSSDVFDFTIYENTTPLPGSTTQRKFGTGGDVGSMSGSTPPFAAVAGDKLSFILSNTSGTGDMTNRNIVIRAIELV